MSRVWAEHGAHIWRRETVSAGEEIPKWKRPDRPVAPEKIRQ